MLKGCLITLCVIVAIVLVGGGVGAYCIFGGGGTALAGEMHEVDYGGQTQEEVAEEAIEDIEDFISDLLGEGDSEKGEEISVTLTEAQVTALIAGLIAEGGDVPISNVLINITESPPEVLMTADVVVPPDVPMIGGWEVAMGAKLTLEVVEGKLSIGIGTLYVGGLPPALTSLVEGWLTSQLGSVLGEVDPSAIDLPAAIDDITLGDGELTISGTVDC